jgi:hypothetical protein
MKSDARPAANLMGVPNPKLDHFATEKNLQIKRRFYLSTEYWLPVLRLRPRIRIGRYTYRPNWEGSHPFSANYSCYYGDHWFTGNRRAARALLQSDECQQKLKRHYRYRTQPDESFYATVLANTPGLTLWRDNKRFAEWNGGGAHPMVLSGSQVEEALASGAFFARKVVAGSEFVRRIERSLAVQRGLAF